MGRDSKIGWTHHTFNMWRGCLKISKGCEFCYASDLSFRNPATLGVWGPEGVGMRVVAAGSYWRQPLKWDREAREAGERRRVFCASLADVFEDWRGPMVNASGSRIFTDGRGAWLPEDGDAENVCDLLTMDDVRSRLLELIHATPHLDWLLLTKRPEAIRPALGRLASVGVSDGDCLAEQWLAGAVMPNVWLGVTAENQAEADRRVPILLDIPAAVRWVSAEPLLGPIDFSPWLRCPECQGKTWDRVDVWEIPCPACDGDYRGGLGWCVVGGESGPHRRPMELPWMRDIVGQFHGADLPAFVKQDSAPRDGRQGRIPDELWSIKEFPARGVEADAR